MFQALLACHLCLPGPKTPNRFKHLNPRRRRCKPPIAISRRARAISARIRDVKVTRAAALICAPSTALTFASISFTLLLLSLIRILLMMGCVKPNPGPPAHPTETAKCSMCNRSRLIPGTELQQCASCATAIKSQATRTYCSAPNGRNKPCGNHAIGLSELLGTEIPHCQAHITAEDMQLLTAHAARIANYCMPAMMLVNELPLVIQRKFKMANGEMVCAECSKSVGNAESDMLNHICGVKRGRRVISLEERVATLPADIRSEVKIADGEIRCSQCSKPFPNREMAGEAWVRGRQPPLRRKKRAPSLA
jgi:hypothetical protein